MLKQVIYGVVIVAVLCGCTATRTNEAEASAEFLTAQGWHKPERFLDQASFGDYAKSIRAEVGEHRIPFNIASAEREVIMASPAEFFPAEECGDSVSGIAILVHGLSDTAFAMYDVANVLTKSCYISRTILLPGHGTRAGDIANIRHKHWKDTLNYVIDQASTETSNILLVGFSLGAVLTLEQAMTRADDIDGIIALSPAYNLSSYPVAKWSRWLHPIVPWIDRGISDDAMRYEAMPTRGVVETINAIRGMNQKLKKHGTIDVPWLLAQSLDDAVLLPEQNQQMWGRLAMHPDSRLIQFYSDERPDDKPRVVSISGKDNAQQVLGLSHLAIHIAPENEHYGRNGDYRNCGLTAPRDRSLVKTCEQADSVWYGLWKSELDAGTPMAISTFNPAFKEFATELNAFANVVAKNAN